jgi:hypothetical protein
MPAPYAAVTPEIEAAVMQDFFAAFQAQFGEDWRRCLAKNLRPSPNAEIAQRYNLPIAKVKTIKQKIWMIGVLLQNSENANDNQIIQIISQAIDNSLQNYVDGTPIQDIATQLNATPLPPVENADAAAPHSGV